MDDPSSLWLPLTIYAGYPSPGVEWQDRRLTIDQLLGMAGEESYSLPMAGNALSGAGVMDGDIIVFSRVIEPVTNDIVLATVNGALYIRRFVTHRGTVFLLPADDAALPIRVEKEDVLRIRGVALCRLHALHPSIRHKMRGLHRNLSDLNHLLGLNDPETVCTHVRGNSMHGSGIYNHDVLIIARGYEAAENDIIIATFNGSFLVKRLVRGAGNYFSSLGESPHAPSCSDCRRGFPGVGRRYG